MKNTLALAIILLGGMLVYGGYKDYSFADTIRFFTGQPLQKKTSSGIKGDTLTPATPKKPNAFTPTPPQSGPATGGTAGNK